MITKQAHSQTLRLHPHMCISPLDHSDFVRLDPSAAAEEHEVPDVMRLSDASATSSSLSSSFRFIHRSNMVLGAEEYVRSRLYLEYRYRNIKINLKCMINQTFVLHRIFPIDHSDFVRLDPSAAAEEHEVPDVMRLSDASATSSSLSSSFRFIHRSNMVLGAEEYVRSRLYLEYRCHLYQNESIMHD